MEYVLKSKTKLNHLEALGASEDEKAIFTEEKNGVFTTILNNSSALRAYVMFYGSFVDPGYRGVFILTDAMPKQMFFNFVPYSRKYTKKS